MTSETWDLTGIDAELAAEAQAESARTGVPPGLVMVRWILNGQRAEAIRAPGTITELGPVVFYSSERTVRWLDSRFRGDGTGLRCRACDELFVLAFEDDGADEGWRGRHRVACTVGQEEDVDG